MATRSLRANRSHSSTLRVLAIAHAQLDQVDKARDWMRLLRETERGLTVRSYLARSPAAAFDTGILSKRSRRAAIAARTRLENAQRLRAKLLPPPRTRNERRVAKAGVGRWGQAPTPALPTLPPAAVGGGRGAARSRYFGERFAKIRCNVRRCIFSRRAVSDTLRSHSS